MPGMTLATPILAVEMMPHLTFRMRVSPSFLAEKASHP
jgi:hypothetical protein